MSVQARNPSVIRGDDAGSYQLPRDDPAELAKLSPPSSTVAAGSIRAVHMVEDTVSGNLQDLYLDLDNSIRSLRSNLTFVFRDGSIFFETNEIGLKGDSVDPGRRQAVVWGDSVVFGIGRGWPCLLDDMLPGYQFLNGGIEGDLVENVLRRAVMLNRERAVALNVILPGWHGNTYTIEECLADTLPHIPNAVLVTMPTALNRHLVNEDLSAWARPGNAEIVFSVFSFAREYSLASQISLFEDLLRRNTAMRKAAKAMGLPLIDLFAVFDTEKLADFRQDFFDVVHPRASAYSKMARAVYEGIRTVVEST